MIRIQRDAVIPDPLRVARYEKAPELGPAILFFSGGSALKRVSKALIRYTHNSIHMITPFDSGGSSAKIRKAFNMLSIGDLRNRLLALADQSVKGNPDVYRLFSFRLPSESDPETLRRTMIAMANGTDPQIARVETPMQDIIRNHLALFLDLMPHDFDLRGANIGNIVLAAGYLSNRRNIDAVLYLFSQLIEARGTVKPIVAGNFHLAAMLSDSGQIVGQHRITGRSVQSSPKPIKELYLSKYDDMPEKTEAIISAETAERIGKADLICYPMGSFYTSVIANLLPCGVGQAVASNNCPKIYIPNTLPDSEQAGMTLADMVAALYRYLNTDLQGAPADYLNWVIIDSRYESYPYPLALDRIRAMGVSILEANLVSPESRPYIDPQYLCHILLSFT